MNDYINRGVLFYETDKKTDKHPDFTGTIDVDGTEWRIAGWKKESKTGNPFISLSVSEYRKQPIKQQSLKAEDIDINQPIDLNDIPF